ncbi:uncharacterized protein LOC131618652 [Vicia villosa]|uniref:uncharacterized protein LOC131618652 n=1 Tax=Vicia villosa TaxID=3911 RepID=UPI00273B74D7|nr:uncharacterized protein LOC131618652 [Vicia villosa]
MKLLCLMRILYASFHSASPSVMVIIIPVFIMARPLAKICDINDSKELWKVSVRVHHKWTVVSNKREHFEMIFVDVSGGDIHVVVPAPHVSLFSEKMVLDHSYTISNFKVQANVAAFRPSSHKFMLKFTAGTTVTDDNNAEIPPKPLVFTKFTDIINGNFNKDVLIDVIGMVESIGYSQTTTGARKQQINMMLRDGGENTINCTLWESYAEQFMKFKQERGDDSGPIFVMIQYAKVKEQGKFPLSVTNTFNVTVLGLNIDLLPMKEFIESFPKDSMITLSGQEGSNSQLSAQNSENQQMTPVQKLLSKAVVMPIGDIIKLRTITFCATVGETKMLVASPYGWYYRGCHVCSCIARGDRAPFECEAGHFTEAEIFRYKIEIEVTHAGNSCNFLFWDRECELLLGLSASQLRHTMIKAGIHDPLEFPLVLDQMLDCKMAFKVKWQPRWKNASVVMLLKNDPFVKELADQFDTDEMKPAAVEAMTTVRSEPNFVVDLDVSSTHNTDPITPTGKRHFPGVSSESTTSDGTCDGELSSNKLKKIIKIEKID